MIIDKLIDFENLKYNWDEIEKISEFKKLKSCEQNPKWHGEGNAWIHTKSVCEYAIKACYEYYLKKYDVFDFDFDSPNSTIKLLLTSALFHDIGKGVTTHQGKDGRWHAYNHEFEGEKITRRLLWNEDCKFRENVCALVKYHMLALQLFDSKDPFGKIIEISREVPSMYTLMLLKRCDIMGSIQEDEIGKQCDLAKMDSLNKIISRLQCAETPFEDYINDYKKIRESEKKHINVYLMIGLPGSGKSTIANDLINKGLADVIVSRDTIREELGYCDKDEKVVLSKGKENEVTKIFNEKILQAAEDGKTIVIDNLNLKKEYRNGYRSLLSNYNVEWIYYYVEAEKLSVNMARRKSQISESVFGDMINKLEWPTINEYGNKKNFKIIIT